MRDTTPEAGGAFYIWHADTTRLAFLNALEQTELEARQILIWNKNIMVISRQDYHWKHEPCLYGWRAGAGHEWFGDRKQTTVLDFNHPTKNIEHPTMKPVELIAYQIGNSSKQRAVVLDIFGGSGSTLIACEKTNRRCYMMELSPKYCDVIINRWQQFTGETAVKL